MCSSDLARPMHELDWQVVTACLLDTRLDICKIHGGVVVTGQNHERSADGLVGAPAVPIVTDKLGYFIPAGPRRSLMSDLRGRRVGVIPASFRRHILVALEHHRCEHSRHVKRGIARFHTNAVKGQYKFVIVSKVTASCASKLS